MNTTLLSDYCNIDKKIYYTPIGGSLGDPLNPSNRTATLEYLYPTQVIIDESINSDAKDILVELLKNGYKKTIIWGHSSKYNIEEDDIVLFGYRNCILYVGKVLFSFNDLPLSDLLWGSKTRWEKKVVLKSLVRVYIPRNQTAYDNTEDIRKQMHIFNFNDEHLKKYSFQDLLLLKKEGNLQGTQLISNTSEITHKIISNIYTYFLVSDYQSLSKIILDDQFNMKGSNNI